MAMNDQEMQKRFLKDIKDHTMEVVVDQGVHRHLRVRNPGKGWSYWFNIVTWPGSLCINGDMGTFVFSRTEDMFEFFRGDKKPNVGYWTEKVVAEDRSGRGTHEYCPDAFREAVLYDLNAYLEGEPDDPELRRRVKSDVLSCADDGRQEAVGAAMGFSYKGRYIFQDFYEHNVERPTTQYLWCLWAIIWAIETYDKAKAGAVAHA